MCYHAQPDFCVYEFVWVCAHVCRCTRVHVQLEVVERHQVSFSVSLQIRFLFSFVWDSASYQTWSSLNYRDCLASKFQGSSYSSLSRAEIRGTCWLFHGCKDLNSSPQCLHSKHFAEGTISPFHLSIIRLLPLWKFTGYLFLCWFMKLWLELEQWRLWLLLPQKSRKCSPLALILPPLEILILQVYLLKSLQGSHMFCPFRSFVICLGALDTGTVTGFRAISPCLLVCV